MRRYREAIAEFQRSVEQVPNPDVWFNIPVPAATKMTFSGTAPGYSFMISYSLDCVSCPFAQESYSGTSFSYTNTTADVVTVHAMLQGYDASGNYTSTGLPAGSYFSRTVNAQGFIDELYNDIA